MNKPLEGIRVLDCSQFLSAPSAGLKIADLGAEVIKVEKKAAVISAGSYTFLILK